MALLSEIYNVVSIRRGLRGKAKAGWIRPTIAQFFTSKYYQNIMSNRPPIANSDSANLYKNGSIIINLIANDTDPEGLLLNMSSYTETTHGSLLNNGDNTVTYNPTTDYVGTDSFNYTVVDSVGNTSSSTCLITIHNPQPINTTTRIGESFRFYVGDTTEFITVKLYGSGGGGGGASGVSSYPAYGGYGGQGAYCEKRYIPVTAGQSIYFNAGAGGGWSSSANSYGSTGSPTYCTELGMYAGGGVGGKGALLTINSEDPISTGGDVNLSDGGSPGGAGMYMLDAGDYSHLGSAGQPGKVVIEEYEGL